MQVGTRQSTLRTLRVRDRYQLPPRAGGLGQGLPSLDEPLGAWRAQVSQGTSSEPISQALLRAYQVPNPFRSSLLFPVVPREGLWRPGSPKPKARFAAGLWFWYPRSPAWSQSLKSSFKDHSEV